MILYPTCVSSVIIDDPQKLKMLFYRVVKSNLKDIINKDYYKKTYRPNLYAEMGYSNKPDSPDRFSNDLYEKSVNDILNTPLTLPPDDDDIILD